MDQPKLYHELSYLWPIISPPGEYAEEAKAWRRILKDRLEPAKRRILELGAGGGHNLSNLTNSFDATAVDISPDMLNLSRRLNPGVQHHVGDMRTLRLSKTFDAVLIHDAIGHMLTEDDLRATFATAKAHLGPGGLLLIAPEWVTEEFEGPNLFYWFRRGKDIAVTIQEYLHDPDPNDCRIESIYNYMIQTPGSVRLERDVHINGLFSASTWMGLLDEAGYMPERTSLPGNEGGYGKNMFVGTLPNG